jgi:hypothetical protein
MCLNLRKVVTKAEERVMRGYTYAAVEAALAKVFHAGVTAQKGALRGRIQNLRRLGLPSGGPGRGKTISYTDARVCAWLIALELEEFGIDPALAVRMIKTRWTDLSRFIREARSPSHRDVIVIVRPYFMSASWALGPEVGQEMFSSFEAGVSETETFLKFLAKEGVRACVFNLSARLRSLDEALKSVQEQEDEAL